MENVETCITLPRRLRDEVRARRLNVSKICREALSVHVNVAAIDIEHERKLLKEREEQLARLEKERLHEQLEIAEFFSALGVRARELANHPLGPAMLREWTLGRLQSTPTLRRYNETCPKDYLDRYKTELEGAGWVV